MDKATNQTAQAAVVKPKTAEEPAKPAASPGPGAATGAKSAVVWPGEDEERVPCASPPCLLGELPPD